MAEFSNPNLPAPGGSGGSGGDMRGMMAVMLLVLLAVFAFDYFKPRQPVTPAPAAQNQAQLQQQPAQPAAAAAPISASGTPKAQSAPPQVATQVIAASIIEQTTVENEKLKIVFTNRGAQVEHWILKGSQYKDQPGANGQQLDLVNSRTAAFGLPLSLYTYNSSLDDELNNKALYKVSTSGDLSSAGVLQAPGSISFHYAANGLDVVKTFHFDASYVVAADVEVKRYGVPIRALLAWPGGLGDQTEAMHFVYGKFAWSLNGKDDSTDAKKVSGGATLDQPFDYAAVSDLYFAAAFLPDIPARTTVVTLHNAIELPTNPSDPNSQKKPADVIGLAMGDTSGSTRVRIFAGPKETDLLKSIHSTGADGKPSGPTLEPLIQFGWLTIIAKPLYLALRYNYKHIVPNWGWSIVIFTTIFNLLMLPTRFSMMKSSLKMMRIQPKVEAIKQRYKNIKSTDPKRAEMNTEMMELYKAEGVNMYGSCLPMLFQMPLFIAYYQVLRNAVELRQAQWFWLNDLSIADPHYILPGIIIVTMFLTQYITPSPGMDPAQRKMMAFMMPVMMGFFFANLASGLALYMSTSGVINLFIQLGVNQSSLGKEMHAIAARKAAKKSGVNPKTINAGPIQKRR